MYDRDHALRNQQTRLSVAKCIAETLPHQLFYITVTYTSKVPVNFPKNTIVATLDEAVSNIFPVGKEITVKLCDVVRIHQGEQGQKPRFDQQ